MYSDAADDRVFLYHLHNLPKLWGRRIKTVYPLFLIFSFPISTAYYTPDTPGPQFVGGLTISVIPLGYT